MKAETIGTIIALAIMLAAVYFLFKLARKLLRAITKQILILVRSISFKVYQWADKHLLYEPSSKSLGKIHYELRETALAKIKGKGSLKDVADKVNAANAIGITFMQRNTEARKLEDEGKTDDAIKLYELNINEGFDGDYPYTGLIRIYRKMGQNDKAIKVCEDFLKIRPEAKSFQKTIDKLRKAS